MKFHDSFRTERRQIVFIDGNRFKKKIESSILSKMSYRFKQKKNQIFNYIKNDKSILNKKSNH